MPTCPLSTLRRPPHERPTHDSESRLVANHYHVGTFTHYSLPAFTGAFTTSLSGSSLSGSNKVGGNVPSWFDKLTTNGTEGSYKP